MQNYASAIANASVTKFHLYIIWCAVVTMVPVPWLLAAVITCIRTMFQVQNVDDCCSLLPPYQILKWKWAIIMHIFALEICWSRVFFNNFFRCWSHLSHLPFWKMNSLLLLWMQYFLYWTAVRSQFFFFSSLNYIILLLLLNGNE